MNLLTAYFRWGEFLHCETYNFVGCCKNIPCTAVDTRFKSAFDDSIAPQLFLQKTHDLENEAPIDNTLSYLIQTRAPSQAAIGWLRWMVTNHEARSLGQVSADLYSFLWYYIRFYHKWCHPGSLDSRVIYYEDLTASPDQLRTILQDTILWAGGAIDAARLESALERTISVDAHTKELKNNFATKQYNLDYYRQVCGPSFNYMLRKIPALCPGLKYENEHSDLSNAEANRALDDLFVLLPLDEKQTIFIDFAANSLTLKSNSLGVAAGSPIYGPFGLSPAERGVGTWTDGDVVLLPFRVGIEGQFIFGKLIGKPVSQLDLDSQLEIYVVVDSKAYPVKHRWKHADDNIELEFSFEIPSSLREKTRDGALVLKFHRLRHPSLQESRKLGILLKKLIVISERVQHATSSL